jgi:sugar/nucleoside kinase (ribokinase family)
MGVEVLKYIYERTDILFCNLIEAKRILETEDGDIIKLMAGLRKLGPKIVVLTDGLDGAYADDGTDVLFVPVYSTTSIVSTGAGDSFASAMLGALILGKDLKDALLWGPINSMSVVSYVGAQKGLLSREKIEEILANAPKEYKVNKIN